MMRFLSRYHPRYIRSLIYMLQASEYDASEFLRWDLRVKDFRRVEHRGHLKYTGKAMLLTALAWFYVAIAAIIIVAGLLPASGDIRHIVALIFVFFFPLMLPYLLAATTRLVNRAQRPYEALIIARAQQKLAAHKSLKIAIAGSYGKTSMREILRTVLSEGKKVAAPGGSENTPLAIAKFIERLQGDEDILIFELGEYYPGDIKALCEFVEPKIGIITGVNEAHLSKFKTVEAAAATIFELADFVSPRDLFVNADSDIALHHAQNPQVRLVGFQEFSHKGAGEWQVAGAHTSLDGTSFWLEKGSVRINARSTLLGLHQVGPLAAAAAIAFSLGFTVEQIESGIAKTKPFAHRMERKDDTGGVITLDDSYNGNPDGVRAAIDFLKSIEGHRRWYATPGLVEMGDRAENIHRTIGRELARAGIEKVVLIKNSVTLWIAEGLKAANFEGELIWFDDALHCYAALPTMTVAGDVVLLQNDWPDQYA